MSSNWEQYVQGELSKENRLTFNEAELARIETIVGMMEKTNQDHMWHALGPEYHRMFLRGYWDRKEPIKDVIESVIETYEFRKKYEVDQIFETRFDKHDQYHSSWPSYVAGEDKWGHFITFERVSEIKTQNLDLVTREELLRYRTQHIEALMEVKRRISFRLGKRVCRYIYVLDLKGLQFKKHFSPKIKNLLLPLFQLSGDRYPESLWLMFLVNTPLAFRFVWRVLAPIIDPVVKTKIRILGGPSQYLPAMEEAGIPLESIPKAIGGKSDVVSVSDIIETIIDNPKGDEEFTTNRLPRCEPPNKLDLLNLPVNDLQAKINLENEKKMHILEELDIHEEGLKQQVKVPANPLVNEENILMEGYMEKRGFYNTSWRRRYLVLVPNGLYYFSQKPDENTKHRGMVDLVLVSKVLPAYGTKRQLSLFGKYKSTRIRTFKTQRSRNKTGHTIPFTAVHDSAKSDSSSSKSNVDDKDHVRKGKFASEVEPESTNSEENGKNRSTSGKELMLGFDLKTPYRTYNFRICEDLEDDELEQISKTWVESISNAAQEKICSLEAIIKQEQFVRNGFMEKRGEYNKAFRRRFFVLTNQRLYYYTDINTNIGSVLKGKIDLLKIVRVEAEPPSKKNVDETLMSVHTLHRVFFCRAYSREELLEWVHAINEACENERQAEQLMRKKTKTKTKRSVKNLLKKRSVEVVATEDDDHDLPTNLPDNAVTELRNDLFRTNSNSINSVNSTNSILSNISVSGVTEGVMDIIREVVKIGSEMKVFIDEKTGNRLDLPSFEDIFEGAKRRVQSTFRMTRARKSLRASKLTRPKQSMEKEEDF